MAYCAAVLVGALLTTAGVKLVFGVADREFLILAAAGIFVLSLPGTLLGLACQGTAAPSLQGAVLVGCVNGLISSVPLVMSAAALAVLIMLPAGAIGGAVFWRVRRGLSALRERQPSGSDTGK